MCTCSQDNIIILCYIRKYRRRHNHTQTAVVEIRTFSCACHEFVRSVGKVKFVIISVFLCSLIGADVFVLTCLNYVFSKFTSLVFQSIRVRSH